MKDLLVPVQDERSIEPRLRRLCVAVCEHGPEDLQCPTVAPIKCFMIGHRANSQLSTSPRMIQARGL